MAKAAAKTGAGPTALVAIEQYFPKEERIIEDELASKILPSGRAFLRLTQFKPIRDWMIRTSEKATPGMWGCMICRKKYIDDKLTEARHQIEAVVNLGAGFDTRAYRLSALSDIPIWELDQLSTTQSKQARLSKIFGKVPSNVNLIAIDFDRQNPETVLKSNGYTLDKPTFFIWEAVSQYLTEEGIRATFDFLGKAASGSRIAFTYVIKEFLDGHAMFGWEKFYKKYVEEDKIWIFGMEKGAWPDFLKTYGWQVIEDIGYEEMTEKYVKPKGRSLASTPIERMVYAEKI